MKDLIRFISIISYLFIMLAGEMIAMPLACWLVFVACDVGNSDQLFATLSIVGIVLHFSKWSNQLLIALLSFLFMLSPLISRMIKVPIEKFNYASFTIPLVIFIATSLIWIGFNIQEVVKHQKSKNITK